MEDKVKTRIKELCPDVMELKFGLPIKYKEKNGIFCTVGNGISEWNIHLRGNSTSNLVPTTDVEISPNITLAVVLRAIDKTNGFQQITVNTKGGFWVVDHLQFCWNLEHDNFDDQDRPTQLFIGSLLGIN